MNEQAVALPISVDRFRVVRELGRGGTSTVYEVEDGAGGLRLALKRLEHHDSDEFEYVAQNFEREYYNLAHFAHPCVVKVHDFGHDQLGQPFYTMELLDGGDLRTLSPLPSLDACQLFVNVCSVLSFLHSRRLIHRDVTPRNIRLTQDGTAKLIDFGTLMVVGPAKRLAGTPPFCAPETLTGEYLDQRADLFSLGVTAYMTLTGRLPYMARSFAELRDAWRTPARPPSYYTSDIPEPLDNLVMSLLQLNRSARPSSAAEVMERLCAVAGMELSEQLVVQQAYLSTPTVVGRDRELLRIRKLLVRGPRARGAAMLVCGAAGTGRSRLLSSSVLEAKLLGLTVLRVDATDAANGAFSAARVLLEQLIDAMPNLPTEITPARLAVLCQLLPALARSSGTFQAVDAPTSSPPPTLRPRFELAEVRSRLQSALLKLIVYASHQRALLVAVDDLNQLDEPSAALIALLVERARDHRLVVIVTADNDALKHSSEALQFVATTASRMELFNLVFLDTHKLLESIFGDVPNLRVLSVHLHRISAGAPGVIMQLAQHLLDRGVLRYQAGAWVLPARISEDELPRSIAETLALRVDQLSPPSLLLLQALALIPELTPNEVELLTLAGFNSKVQLLEALDDLVAADLVSSDNGYYRLAHGSFGALLRSRIDKATTVNLHLRLAAFFARNPTEGFWVVDQLVRAGELQRALDQLLPLVNEWENLPIESVVAALRTLPADWMSILRALVEYCDRAKRPRRERVEVQSLIVALNAGTATAPTEDLYELLIQFYTDCGLDIYHALSADIPQAERLGRALEGAQQRYDATPESERVAPPAIAIPRLAKTVVMAIAILGTSCDSVLRDKVPSIDPLAPLSPTLEHIARNARYSHDMIVGRHHRAQAGYTQLIERIDQPDLAGFDPLYQRYIRLSLQYALSSIESQYGMPSALDSAKIIEADFLFEANACHARLLYALATGDEALADNYRHRAELLRIQNGPSPFFEGSGLIVECACYGFVNDLARLKQIIPGIEAMTRSASGWQAVLHWAQGLYQKILGERERALQEFTAGLKTARAGENRVHLFLAAGAIETLTALGRITEACEEGERYLSVADANDLGPLTYCLLEAVACAYAANGNHTRAKQLAFDAVARLKAFGAGGIVLGGAYETLAKVALASGAEQEFREYAEKCAACYKPDQQSMLAARYAALMRLAEGTDLSTDDETDEPDGGSNRQSASAEIVSSSATTELRSNRASKPRFVERALKKMIEATGAVGGYLFTLRSSGPVLDAQWGTYALPSDLTDQVALFLSAELESSDAVTVTSGDATALVGPFYWTTADGGSLCPTLLSHYSRSKNVITGVVVLRSRDDTPVYPPHQLCVSVSAELENFGEVVTAIAAT